MFLCQAHFQYPSWRIVGKRRIDSGCLDTQSTESEAVLMASCEGEHAGDYYAFQSAPTDSAVIETLIPVKLDLARR